MAIVIDTPVVAQADQATATRGPRPGRAAAVAVARLSRIGLVLSALGLGSCVLLLLRLAETWRVGTEGGGHSIGVLGQHLAYPAANAAAFVILALALLGLVAIALIVLGAAKELIAVSRFGRELAGRRGFCDRRVAAGGLLCRAASPTGVRLQRRTRAAR